MCFRGNTYVKTDWSGKTLKPSLSLEHVFSGLVVFVRPVIQVLTSGLYGFLLLCDARMHFGSPLYLTQDVTIEGIPFFFFSDMLPYLKNKTHLYILYPDWKAATWGKVLCLTFSHSTLMSLPFGRMGWWSNKASPNPHDPAQWVNSVSGSTPKTDGVKKAHGCPRNDIIKPHPGTICCFHY